MTCYLLWNKAIRFRLTNQFLSDESKREGKIDLVIGSNDLTAYGGGGGDASQNWNVLSKLKDLIEKNGVKKKEKSLKIILEDVTTPASELTSRKTRLSVHISGGLLQEIRNQLGPDVRIKLEFFNAQASRSNAFSFSEQQQRRYFSFGGAGGGGFGNGREVGSGGGGSPHFLNDSRPQTIRFGIGPANAGSGTFTISSNPSPGRGQPDKSSSEMKLMKTENSIWVYCEDKMEFPDGWKDQWLGSMDDDDDGNDIHLEFSADISLLVTVSSSSTGGAGGDKLGDVNWQCGQVNKRLLLEELRTDVEIIAGNGNAIRCHSAFLVVHSEVLKTMLESGMQESATNQISMPDETEEGVRAFLAYLYYRDLDRPLNSSSIAVELLQMGHKYLVNCLEDAVRGILESKPEMWFEANSALRLFFFAGKLDSHRALKLKAVQVLKAKPSAVLSSEDYNRLFEMAGDDILEDGAAEKEDDANKQNCTHGAQLQAVKELCNALLSTPGIPVPPLFPSNSSGFLTAKRKPTPKK